jgi:hypothetical protein
MGADVSEDTFLAVFVSVVLDLRTVCKSNSLPGYVGMGRGLVMIQQVNDRG